MTKLTKKWLIIASALVVSGLAVMTGAIVAVGFDYSKLNTLEYETNTYEMNEDFDKISVDTNIADIKFVKSDDESCKVICFEAEKMRHTVSCKNETLTICGTDERKWYECIGISFDCPNITIYLPESEYSLLYINTNTGDIDIPESFAFNELEIETDTGSVECVADVSDTVKIESNTGDVSISFVESDCNIDVNTDTGSIKLTDINCTNFNVESDTGDISFTNVVAKGNGIVKCDTGDIKLKSSDAVNISIETNTGDITGTLLSPKKFTAKSDTGDVDVPDTETGGKCEIITDTGDIRIDIK